ncbi:N(4)-(beta-N-acetylglucosaminyl)-L-asparaginase [Leadbettera azotonutricia]|uniref:N(4)-(Beta-N-acetylglucosaminyl)-L-asparaginase (Glycosylasparaginase) (Aspartylglucosaminidase) (N4-(N-acetyl-beta-glucosaminyl)-L-asparagine amidase) (AGA) n=1 Tax=Leadbettera azotonutricia (strain ATCC BAA-888 / DSM 13862 / ZAS-9) TaxID=545695 RepID=F5Y7Y1_LEAAZ|nr:N(4)-(beta-N-acetylglucosaminyl)-L-asparaginase [Leadbettera azotonutricia]AEF80807.1 N(4)-(Beta-N-acetylglucosaminyl)-L-asparaginase (Glycosylasparaginase) (Aspartylglucosaminidase) (N4-(N-acetyl-beta-glucosaminyl)-L-asparagine amidase) (AGA) [Leadbettera azotonutricia ZAS-9]
MKYAVIGTWKMAHDGVCLASEILEKEGSLAEAIKRAINDVENNPEYLSVGYGGLPNREGEVELDAAYMDGSTGLYGSVIGAKGIANPIDAAIELGKRQLNCMLSGEGAEKYARMNGFEIKNMLTGNAKKRWLEMRESAKDSVYQGHDTVGVIVCRERCIAAGVSTSGLFYKEPGRVGDSPIIGGGLYCLNGIGGAAATGVGEDILRGCLSYEAVRQMESGKSAQQACDDALAAHIKRMDGLGIKLGDISLVALDAGGGLGAATNMQEFPFVYADQDNAPALWLASAGPGRTIIDRA